VFADVDVDTEGVGRVWRVCFSMGLRSSFSMAGALSVAGISEFKDTIEFLLDDLREFERIEARPELSQFLEFGRISELAGPKAIQ
jgi:hypothetical protein